MYKLVQLSRLMWKLTFENLKSHLDVQSCSKKDEQFMFIKFFKYLKLIDGFNVVYPLPWIPGYFVCTYRASIYLY